MITLLHPEIMPHVRDLSCGLMPIQLEGEERFSLIVKTRKEAILAAKMNGGFAFYLPVLPSSRFNTTALVSAFFDDYDEPLVIRSPLFEDDSHSHALLEILGYDELDIYFFDEQNYEWMSFRTRLEDGGSWLTSEEKIRLLSYHPETTMNIHQAVTIWFGQRTSDDDERAIQAVFKNELHPNGLVLLDMTPAMNNYLGSAGFRHDSLIRTNPGYFQEREIAACLLRVFEEENIIMNPRRKDTNKEVLDHLVLTDNVAIFIQAKDSPTTEASINRPLERKRRATHRQIEAAIRQINGAARYFDREPVAKLVVGDENVELSIGKRQVIGIAIVKELFNDEGRAYADACTQLSGLSGGGVVMDYSTFHAFTHHFTSADVFVEALDAIIVRIQTEGWFHIKNMVFNDMLDLVDEIGQLNSGKP